MTALDAMDAGPAADPASYARAILNILGDFSEEKTRLYDTQKAILNILEDAGTDKLDLEAAQKAALNILQDLTSERARLEGTQKAVLNILQDFSEEKAQLGEVQKAILNILEDFEGDKSRLDVTQRAILNILDDSAEEQARLSHTQRAVLNILDDFGEERARLGDTQRAVLNILEDFDAEKNKVERTNREMAREIAERRLTEEALRQAKTSSDAANREIEAFSYSVSHDLRQPLRGITGFCRMLVEDHREQLDAQAREYLDTIVGQAEKMGRLIDELLMLSRISRQEMERVDVDLTALCNEVVVELRKLDPGRHVDVRVAERLQTWGDPRLLRIALQNLIGNAWKYTSKRPDGRIEIGSRQERGLPAFFVADNGVGFDMKYADKLFGAFQRLHRASEFEGSGIGLATVQRIMHRHGGRVWADAEVGKGATFLFSL